MRISGFHKLTIAERRERIADEMGLDGDDRSLLRTDEPLSLETANVMIENAVGVFGLPMGVAANFLIDSVDVLVPMVVEEPSVVAASSNAARIMRSGGGIRTSADAPNMIGQIQVIDLEDALEATLAIEAASGELLEIARGMAPRMLARGGGPNAVEVEQLTADSLVVHVTLDVGDAMGANMINTLMEQLAPEITARVGGLVNLRILSNLADRRLARAEVSLPVEELATDGMAGAEVARRIARASEFASVSPHRAVTHNKGVMNGVDSVAIATGQDWRAIEAGAHAWAARDGRYGPLAVWTVEDGLLWGRLELPLAVGTVGERIRINPRVGLALRILGVERASELARVMAAVGLAQNFAALRAMATVGIQHGHMRLHRRTEGWSAAKGKPTAVRAEPAPA